MNIWLAVLAALLGVKVALRVGKFLLNLVEVYNISKGITDGNEN